VERIVASGFLQFSSSHVSLLGETGTLAVVKVFSPYHCAEQAPEFLVSSESRIAEIFGENGLNFRFAFQ
jgi:hypothetical protein